MNSDIAALQGSIGFVKQTGNPNKWKNRPPPLAHPAALEQVVKITENWLVALQIFAPNDFERVLNTTGLVLWFPKYGVGTIFHMAIVGQNALSDRSTYMAWNSLTNYGGNGTSLASGTMQFIYTKALALPRFDIPIVLGTDLGLQFSKAREYGGILECYSSTVATGATALNGLLTTAVISDTRDICQSANGTDCFATSQLAENARTTKEIVSEINAATGVINLQGADIDDSYTPPDAFGNVRADGGWYTAPFIGGTIGGLQFTVTGNQQAIFGGWYSPWAVQCLEGWAGTGLSGTSPYGLTAGIGPTGPVNIAQIQEMGTMRAKFVATMTGSLPTTGDTYVTTICEHVFAGISNSTAGRIQYQSLRTTRSSKITLVPTVVGNSNAFQSIGAAGIDVGIDSDIRDQYISKGGMGTMGKFIGIKIAVFVTSTFNAAGTFTVTLSSRWPGTTQYGFAPSTVFSLDSDLRNGPMVSFLAQEINSPGQTGPCHVIRYDGIGVGQSMCLKGSLNVEAVASQSIAHLVQSQMMTSRMAMHSNVYPLVYALYNGDSSFKCSWPRDEWSAWSASVLENLSADSLVEMGRDDNRIDQAVSAAGIFGAIGNIAGSLGGLINPKLGQVISGVGNLADSVIGSSAQFGATGQFGPQSRGEYGVGVDGAGQFGVPNNSVLQANGQYSGQIRGRAYF